MPRHTPSRRTELLLWTGLLLAPLAWGVSLIASYAFVAQRCSIIGTALLTIVTVAVAGVGMMVALRQYRRLLRLDGEVDTGSSIEGEHGGRVHRYDYGTHERLRLMARTGWILGALMVTATAAHGVSLLIIGCR